MCLDFDGHHSGGSSLICIKYLDYVLKCGPYPQAPVRFKKKKKKKRVPVLSSRPGNRFGSANRVELGFGA